MTKLDPRRKRMSTNYMPVGDSYEDAIKFIRQLPQTWIPALLLELSRTGYKKKCFVPGGSSTLLKRLEEAEGLGVPLGSEGKE